MRAVILESPYKGSSPWRLVAWWQRWQNRRYARRCMHDALLRGEAPFASHLLYTQRGILNDHDPHERQWGIEAGLLWGEFAEATVVYTDRGISYGMKLGIDRARMCQRPVVFRTLYPAAAVTGIRDLNKRPS
jgi:hypothetical protein